MTDQPPITATRFFCLPPISLLLVAVAMTITLSESHGQNNVFSADSSLFSLNAVDERWLPVADAQTEITSILVPVSILEGDDLSRPARNSVGEPTNFRPFAEWENDDVWFAQVLPQGIIYRSYWAGLHEPRLGVQLLRVKDSESYWDPTMGARIGLFRYGNDDPLHPQGWQLDIEGAAMARLTLDYWRDLDTVDFRGGVPLTFGIDNWQFKLAYYHLSSHLGDEFVINHPGSLDDRANYVRDAVTVGVSWFPVDFMRTYAEVGYAFNATGGADALELQFGSELSRPGVTDAKGTPFAALNVHLREEHNFGGDFNIEGGWLWRDRSGHTLRIGAFYFNGKSSQYQFYNDSQQQTGGGIWYDF